MKRFLVLLVGFFMVLNVAHVLATPARAAEPQLTLGVDGMIWPIWAYGVQKALSRLEGVGEVKVSLEKALAEMTLKEGARVDPAALRDAVKKAGFTPRELRMTTEGHFLRVDNMLAFKVEGSGQLFRLEENAALDRLRNSAPGERRLLTATGKVIGDAQPLTLQVLDQQAGAAK